MSKKASGESRGPGRPPAEKPRVRRLSVRLRPDLADSLAAFLASLRPQPSETSVIEAALEDYLQGKGFWSSAPGGKK